MILQAWSATLLLVLSFGEPLGILSGHDVASWIRPFAKFRKMHWTFLPVLPFRVAVVIACLPFWEELDQPALSVVIFLLAPPAHKQLLLPSFDATSLEVDLALVSKADQNVASHPDARNNTMQAPSKCTCHFSSEPTKRRKSSGLQPPSGLGGIHEA